MCDTQYIRDLAAAYGIAPIPKPTVVQQEDKQIAEALLSIVPVIRSAIDEQGTDAEIEVHLNQKWFAYRRYIFAYCAAHGWLAIMPDCLGPDNPGSFTVKIKRSNVIA